MRVHFLQGCRGNGDEGENREDFEGSFHSQPSVSLVILKRKAFHIANGEEGKASPATLLGE
jgi:hypothetical protein